MLDLGEMRRLLNDYDGVRRQSIDGLRVFLDVAEPHAKDMLRAHARWRSSSSPRFNVFHITRRSHFETTTHSAFLRELLDPRGAHEQGSLFIEVFMSHLVQAHKAPPQLQDEPATWIVRTEFPLPGGRIDLYLENRLSHEHLTIENKVYAEDRQDQLFDYWDWMRRQSGRGSHPIVYLTRDGSKPKGTDLAEHPELKRDLICLSYRLDVVRVLELCRESSASIPVGIILDQYVQCIKEL